MTDHDVPVVEMTGISKEFPGVKALSDIHLQLRGGEVHVLFGENGAGKSTLISILSGVYRPTAGSIKIAGQSVEFHSVHDAACAGIGTVFQEFSLVPTLKVFENLYLGRELKRGPFIDRRAMISGARKLFAELDFIIDVERPASSLSRAQQQMIEIAKAFLSKARVLILDEPTASLTERETESLFAFIRQASAAGVGIIYISHRIQEFQRIADRISVLRDGRLIATVPAKETSEKKLIELMTGRAVDLIYPKIAHQAAGPIVMTFRRIQMSGVYGVDLDVRAGEVLGVAGLVGSGKSRFWRGALGLEPIKAGAIYWKGRDITNKPTRDLVNSGMFFLPSDRKSEGLQMVASARENIGLSLLDRSDVVKPGGIVSARRSTALTDAIGKRVGIAKPAMDRAVSKLSGGNQQKVLFGKGFGDERDIYIFDEPTVGVDMSTRIALYQLIKEIAEAGKAVVVISSDLPEVMNLANRLIVFSKGKISAELSGSEISAENVLRYFFAETEAPREH